MSLEALIFDLDGTMADTEEVHREAFNAAFEKFDLRWNWGPLLYSELLDISGGLVRLHRFVDTMTATLDEKKKLHAIAPDIHRTKSNLYAQFLDEGRAALRPGVERLIREARAEGLKVGVVSTTASANALALLRKHLSPAGLDRVDALVSAAEAARRKPAPDIYNLALAGLNRSPRVCFAFEDSANGLRAARAAGLFTVVTPTRWTMAQDFSGADLLIRGLGDPGSALHPADAELIGAEVLGISELRRIHEAALQRGGPARVQG